MLVTLWVVWGIFVPRTHGAETETSVITEPAPTAETGNNNASAIAKRRDANPAPEKQANLDQSARFGISTIDSWNDSQKRQADQHFKNHSLPICDDCHGMLVVGTNRLTSPGIEINDIVFKIGDKLLKTQRDLDDAKKLLVVGVPVNVWVKRLDRKGKSPKWKTEKLELVPVSHADVAAANPWPAGTPKKYDEIESLTEAQARDMIDNWNLPSHLALNGLEDLSPEVARVLSEHAGQSLMFDGVTQLLPETAESLSRFRGALALTGLTELSAEAAEALARHSGKRLNVRGLKTIDAEVARRLSQHPGELFLGIESLSPAAAAALADRMARGHKLDLSGLKTMTPEVASSLVRDDGGWLAVGLPMMDSAVAAALARHKGTLVFSRLFILGPEEARELSRHTGSLHLDQLDDISLEAAKRIAEHQGKLSLRGLRDCKATVRNALRKHPNISMP